MGYYLPITDYAGQQYRRRLEKKPESPYHIERSYRIIFHPIKSDERAKHELKYEKAKIKRLKDDNVAQSRKRFSRKVEEEGKGEYINVQV